jgi:hypothetical protein
MLNPKPQAQGIRIEWDPAPVTRTRPLSGFIIHLDQCTQVTSAYSHFKYNNLAEM